MQVKTQLEILESVQSRFDSSLHDIAQLVRADLFDSELDAARELAKNGFPPRRRCHCRSGVREALGSGVQEPQRFEPETASDN